MPIRMNSPVRAMRDTVSREMPTALRQGMRAAQMSLRRGAEQPAVQRLMRIMRRRRRIPQPVRRARLHTAQPQPARRAILRTADPEPVRRAVLRTAQPQPARTVLR